MQIKGFPEISLQTRVTRYAVTTPILTSFCLNILIPTPVLHLYYPQTRPARSRICLNTVSGFSHALIQDCKPEEEGTYAAVAVKFSTRFASVTKLKQTLNIAVNAHTIPNLAVIFRTSERIMMAVIGTKDETNVPSIFAMRWKWVSR